MLAILLVSIIQMCQRKQLSLDIDKIKSSTYESSMRQPDMKIFESMTDKNDDYDEMPVQDDTQYENGYKGLLIAKENTPEYNNLKSMEKNVAIGKPVPPGLVKLLKK